MDGYGDLFAGPQGRGLHHSSFLGPDGPIGAAGKIEAADGTMKYMNRKSGHFEPPESPFMDQLKVELRARGIDPSAVTFAAGFVPRGP